jgi:hypothetical protein
MVCHVTLAVTATSGLYEGSFAPPLAASGDSVRGRLAARLLSRRLGLTRFASEPAP